MSQVKVSVIIPTYHRNDLLAKCIDCLSPKVQTLPHNQYEVIVTDDGFQTTAEEMLHQHYPWARWIGGPHQGPAANRNHGANYAQGEWLAFTDDDCQPDPHWLSAFVEAMQQEALALEGKIYPIGDPNQDMAECPINLKGGYFWSANIAVQRSLFKQVGGFDPSYPLAAHEDADLRLRLSQFTEILFIPDASVGHPVRITSLKEIIASTPKSCAAWAYHVKKNRRMLGYEKPFSFTIEQYKYHLLNFYRNLYKHHFKSSMISMIMLLIGIPLNLFYLHSIDQKTQGKC